MTLPRALPAACALLALAGALRLTPPPHALQTSHPPLSPGIDLALIALSGARGIISEVLWYQVATLQREDRYIEIVPLSEWITRLDPRATGAWRYQAWNLAFNVSAMLPEEERWPWVQRGIGILKESALRWNPGAPGICNELSWFYSFKIGGTFDAAHLIYKRNLAREAAPHLTPAGRRTAASTPWFTAQGMNPASIDALEAAYAPLDWRLPEAYALYWSHEALRLAALLPPSPDTTFELLEAKRTSLYLLTALIDRGTFTGDPAKGGWATAPALPLVLPLLDRTQAYLDTYGPHATAALFNHLISLAAAHNRPDLARNLERALDTFR